MYKSDDKSFYNVSYEMIVSKNSSWIGVIVHIVKAVAFPDINICFNIGLES